MKKVLGVVVALVLMLAAGNQSAQAIGVYADVPLSYTFTFDCSQDCTKKPEGMKVGMLFGNMGVGMEAYSIKESDAVSSTKVSFSILDFSYLLPIPIINITGGIGLGRVDMETEFGVLQFSGSGGVSQVWVSLGATVLAVVDLHVGYHRVKARAQFDGNNSVTLNGNMMSIGAMINF